MLAQTITLAEVLKKLKPFLEQEGYRDIRIIEGRGICAIKAFVTTTAIVYGLDDEGYIARYCYPHTFIKDLIYAYSIWDGKSDPMGRWIKHKGWGIDLTNPNYLI